MTIRLRDLLQQMKNLESELAEEIQKAETDFLYKMHGKKVVFAAEVKALHQTYAVPVIRYLYESSFLNILSTPVIWIGLLPIVLLDVFLTIFQAVCFPIYGIPKVRRREYIVMDRSRIHYLNIIEKINCAYCSYFNGVISFAQEIAGRTEQYWCPIKHARRVANMHSRYVKFLEYGDAENYQQKLSEVRSDFVDL